MKPTVIQRARFRESLAFTGSHQRARAVLYATCCSSRKYTTSHHHDNQPMSPPKVEVLTEERDVARSHEEDLFAKLTDRTDDLEALQESYVSLTDRFERSYGDGLYSGSMDFRPSSSLNACSVNEWVIAGVLSVRH